MLPLMAALQGITFQKGKREEEGFSLEYKLSVWSLVVEHRGALHDISDRKQQPRPIIRKSDPSLLVHA